ncbi:MAG TPA: hypothetical protein PKV16_03000 [Caldisericia bacterium]|nr:hypothetical protein [Caldisericia bacterium]HPF48279.1 hypothetical protein [Caldisericia bacterium]HPI83542.1 hypothetical protein [Caldisericia bacterium]HPQ92732.1 hypothetical protein [Caldisericia bacterium]HRV74170.1 hypothetical protein [Caldisericia bacterium]
MERKRISIAIVAALLLTTLIPIGANAATVEETSPSVWEMFERGMINRVDYEANSTPMVACTFSTSWVKNPASYYVNPGCFASFKLVIEPTSMCAQSYTIVPLTEGFTFASLDTATVSPGEELETNISIVMPEKNGDQTRKTFKFRITPNTGPSREISFAVNYAQGCDDFVTGWQNNPSNYELKAGKQATFKFTVKNRCDSENLGITISTDDHFISFSNKDFNVLAGKPFTIEVTVTMPPTRPNSNIQSNTWNFTVSSESGVTKNIGFTVDYDK